MSNVTGYIESIQFHNMVIKNRTEGFQHDDSMMQLPFEGNCLNWNLGHLMVYRDQMLGFIDGTSTADEAEFAMYGAGSQPLTDGSKAIPFDSLMERLASGGAALAAALEAMPSERLDVVLDEERGITVRKRFEFYLLFHEPYHIGQMEILQALAKDGK